MCLVEAIVLPPIRALLSRLASRSWNSLRSIPLRLILFLVLNVVRRLVGGAVVMQIKSTRCWNSVRLHCLLGLSLYEI